MASRAEGCPSIGIMCLTVPLITLWIRIKVFNGLASLIGSCFNVLIKLPGDRISYQDAHAMPYPRIYNDSPHVLLLWSRCCGCQSFAYMYLQFFLQLGRCECIGHLIHFQCHPQVANQKMSKLSNSSSIKEDSTLLIILHCHKFPSSILDYKS